MTHPPQSRPSKAEKSAAKAAKRKADNSANSSLLSNSEEMPEMITMTIEQITTMAASIAEQLYVKIMPVMMELLDNRLKATEWPPLNAAPLKSRSLRAEELALDRLESNERYDKQTNMVLCNIPEPPKIAVGSNDKNSIDPDKNDDLKLIIKIAEENNYVPQDFVVRVFRMGKKSGSRPVKVIMTESGFKQDILTYSGRQEITKAYKSFLSPDKSDFRLHARHDLTNMQRVELRFAYQVTSHLKTVHTGELYSVRYQSSMGSPLIYHHVTLGPKKTRVDLSGNPADKAYLDKINFKEIDPVAK